MGSFISWMDFSEGQRRRVLDAVDVLRQEDVRDELGIGSVRDAFSDILFPGTGTVQTRARYFFFVPWIYRELEEKGKDGAEIPRLARAAEITLIEGLLSQGERDGVIGIEARQRLKRLPSNIYWLGLGTYGIRRFQGSQDAFHRYLRRPSISFDEVITDDGEVLGGRRRLWDPALPAKPDGFPKEASFRLTREEATYLRERILLSRPHTLLEFLVDAGEVWDPVDFPWEHPEVDRLRPNLKEQVQEAARFSNIFYGASVLYNLLLAEESKDSDREGTYREQLEGWADEIRRAVAPPGPWPGDRFWEIARSEGANISPRTEGFVQAWARHAAGVASGAAPDAESARRLISEREREVKGPKRARLHDPSALAGWNGAAGLGRLDYRWRKAQRIVLDIIEGLRGRTHA